MLKVLDEIKSCDNATKSVVQFSDGLVGEVTHIAYTNKDIVCLPTQTGCRMGCKFCHLTTDGEDVKIRNLTKIELVDLMRLGAYGIKETAERPLLFSFMGAGEPLNNPWAMIDAMLTERSEHIRFAFATMIPKNKVSTFLMVVNEIADNKLPVKVHLSLHSTREEVRSQLMPMAADIKTSISLLETYARVTGNPVEIHYTLMNEVNDDFLDAWRIAELTHGRDMNVKILHHSENKACGLKPSQNLSPFSSDLRRFGVQHEYYKPNGLDIGASCGQFQLDQYVRG